ncbi:MAG: MaoC family dehydratase N-terminal domain-containing protein [Deltaproteobacteria bacterium]|nr:MaoC family dehydratase N-terminal domain-containing protein [Deltaproteobacteria bacterium]MBI3294187.1 MaoC family dehydratase N-terminal domain-containing protein [Deltaproteobacteria bacterium]
MEISPDFHFDQVHLGDRHSHEYPLSEELHQSFMALFGDTNPLHADKEFAQKAGFQGPVIHGGILHGLLSHFIGRVFPGRQALLLGADVRYHAPSYPGDSVEIETVVAQRIEGERALILHLTIRNLTQCGVVARGKITVGFTRLKP